MCRYAKLYQVARWQMTEGIGACRSVRSIVLHFRQVLSSKKYFHPDSGLVLELFPIFHCSYGFISDSSCKLFPLLIQPVDPNDGTCYGKCNAKDTYDESKDLRR